MMETKKITFEEFEKKWSQLERMKEIRNNLPAAGLGDFLTIVNERIADKEKELISLIPGVIENI